MYVNDVYLYVFYDNEIIGRMYKHNLTTLATIALTIRSFVLDYVYLVGRCFTIQGVELLIPRILTNIPFFKSDKFNQRSFEK